MLFAFQESVCVSLFSLRSLVSVVCLCVLITAMSWFIPPQQMFPIHLAGR